MSKTKKLLILLAGFTVLGGVYWGVGGTRLTVPVTYIYYGVCLILSVLYVLVAGGLAPIAEEDRRREEKSRKQYLADKGKSHPIKRRDKYRRFRMKTEAQADPLPAERAPAPNLLGIPEEKRGTVCTWLLLIVIPFYLIFLLDWVYLKFFAGI